MMRLTLALAGLLLTSLSGCSNSGLLAPGFDYDCGCPDDGYGPNRYQLDVEVISAFRQEHSDCIVANSASYACDEFWLRVHNGGEATIAISKEPLPGGGSLRSVWTAYRGEWKEHYTAFFDPDWNSTVAENGIPPGKTVTVPLGFTLYPDAPLVRLHYDSSQAYASVDIPPYSTGKPAAPS